MGEILMGKFRSSSYTNNEFFKGKHRFEHWYRDNSVYFITSKIRDGHRAFASEQAKAIFWDRLTFYAGKYGLILWVVTLLDNHYHLIGHLKTGTNLGPFMQKFHGSVAKLVNDLLPQRHLPFWRTRGNKDYYDGCLRSPLQADRSSRYTLKQAVRAGIVKSYRDYPHTKLFVDLRKEITKADERNTFPIKVRYPRYARRGRFSDHDKT